MTNIAVLVDGDNVSPVAFNSALEEIHSRGRATVRRIYGDFRNSGIVNGWARALDTGFAPVHVPNICGKNSTDMALAVDAIDLMHRQGIRYFIIVSSDSDYRWLVTRLRENNCYVVGIGNAHASQVYTANLDEYFELDPIPRATLGPSPQELLKVVPIAKPETPEDIFTTVAKVVDISKQYSDSWAELATVGTYLSVRFPSFNHKAHGFKKLKEMIDSRPDLFELRQTAAIGGPVLVRLKPEGLALLEKPVC